MLPRSIFVIAAATIGLVACGDATAPKITGAPEHAASSVLPLGVKVSEAIDGVRGVNVLGDSDVFTFDLPVGTTAEVFIHQDSAYARSVTGDLRLDGGPFRTSVLASSSTMDFEEQASGVITAPGHYTLAISAGFPEVLGLVGVPYSGPYQVGVMPIDSAPEHASAALTPGTVVTTESIDHVGDVDTFTLSGTPGARYNLFLGASGSTPHGAVARVVASPPVTVVVDFSDTATFDDATGVFQMPASGSVQVTVSDRGDKVGLYRGPYSLVAEAINSAPESVPPVLAPAGGPVHESIDVLGDIDDYALTLGQTTLANLRLASDAITKGNLHATLLQGADSVLSVAIDPTHPARSTGDSLLAPGDYTLEVRSGASDQTGFAGPYVLELRPVNTAPESVAASAALGDTISAEGIDYAGDVDRFTIHLQASDTLRVILEAVAGEHLRSERLTLADTVPGGTQEAVDMVADSTATVLQSGLIAFGAAGDHVVQVASPGTAADTTARQSYRLRLERASGTPEHVSSSIAPGDSVGSESIDYDGDVDDFFVNAVAGTNFVVRIGDFGQRYYSGLSGAISVAGLADTIRGVQMGAPVSGMLTMPLSGNVRVRMSGVTGPYWIQAIPVDTMPEGASHALTLGDSTAESIGTYGDIDAYTFAATAGSHATIDYKPYHSGQFGLKLRLIDVTTGEDITSMLGSEDASVVSTTVTLPNSGNYEVRVADGVLQDVLSTYWFRVSITP